MSGTKWDELFQKFFLEELTPPKGPVEPLASYGASPLLGRRDVKLGSNRRITMPVRFCKDTTSYALFPHPISAINLHFPALILSRCVR